MLQNSAGRLLVPAIRNGLQRRCQSVISGPPSVRVSSAEKFILGGLMCASWLIVPGWVLLHIKQYKGDK